jgi:hypothetical protein
MYTNYFLCIIGLIIYTLLCVKVIIQPNVIQLSGCIAEVHPIYTPLPSVYKGVSLNSNKVKDEMEVRKHAW